MVVRLHILPAPKNIRPVVRFKQTIPPTHIETVAGNTYTWDVHAGQEVYFYSAPDDTSLIAGLKNVSNDCCVAATVTGSKKVYTRRIY